MTGRIALVGASKAALLLAAGALSGIGYYRTVGATGPGPALPAPAADRPSPIQALGSIQPDGGVVEVALPPGGIPNRLGEGIAQGASVRKGQVIAYLDGHEARLREIAVVDAELAAAEKAIGVEDENERAALAEIDRERDQALKLGAMEQASLRRKIAALDDKLALCRKQFGKIQGLQDDNLISRQKYDECQAEVEISREERDYAAAEAERSAAALALNTAEPRVEQQRKRARLLADRARSQLSAETLRAKRALGVEMVERSKVVAPIDGVILDLCTQVGESGAGKPLARLGDTRRVYVLAEVYEEDGHRVRPGQKAEVRARGLPGGGAGPIPGVVERIQPIIGAHKQSMLDPTARDNARVFPVWIALDLDPEDPAKRAELARLRDLILMPVEVTIRVEPDAG